MIEKKGDLLHENVDVIVHQVNCKGVMGAGIAKQIKQKYPKAFQQYQKLCKKYSSNSNFLLGEVQLIPVHNGPIVCNLFGQDGYGKGCNTNYEAFEAGCQKIAMYAKTHHLSVGFPKYIGCGLAGGDWNIVYPIIEKYFSDLECYIVDFN